LNSATSEKIAILGGNSETGVLVQVANSMGLYTLVLDPYSHSPAKRYASKSYNIDVKDLNAVDRVICERVLLVCWVGIADPLVPYYQRYARVQLHCYATEILVQALTSKTIFCEDLC